MSGQERAPVEINAGKSSPTVEIVWDDGHRSLYMANRLRELCPCATCREGKGKPGHEPMVKPSPNPKEAAKPRFSLPMFNAEKFQIVGMNYVGRYALGVTWKDAHQSIFPWATLSEECPCDQCEARRKNATEEQ